MPERVPLRFDPVAEARRQWEQHGWGDAAQAMAVVTSIMRAQQVLLGRADATLRPLRLTFARYEVLMLLSFSRSGALPLGKIGERLQVNPASVTNAIDRLEEGGLVERVPNPADGRGILARLTAAGREAASAATEAMNRDVFGDVGVRPADLEVLFRVLRDLRRAAGDFDEDRTPAPAQGTAPAGGAAATAAGAPDR